MAKQGFIKNNWQKDASNVALEAGIRAGGGLMACWATNKFFSYKKKADGTTTSETIQNLAGPGMVVLGVLGDLMLSDTKLRAFCQGVTVYGFSRSLAVISPDGMAEKLGMQISTSKQKTVNGIGALGETSEVEEQDAALMGDAEDIKAIAAGEQTYNDTDGKTYNNDWAYLAENIDYADDITKTVSGVDSDAANLMGTESNEEAALLMGMF